MKFTLIFLIIGNLLQAQISGHVEYDYRVMGNVDYRTNGILKFNSHKSFFTTFRVESENDSVPKLVSADGNTLNYVINSDTSEKPKYFTDKENDLLISLVYRFRENYMLRESLPQINWNITSEFKILGEFQCQKAVGYFRGRTYTVWFTESIPVSFGPWKLQGLPGLILEATDNENRYVYRATKIKLDTNDIIAIPDASAALPLKTYVTQTVPSKMKALHNRMQAQADRSITISSSVGIDRSSLQEIIYEWENEEGISKQ